MTHERLNQALWWLCLVIAPLVLLMIELLLNTNWTDFWVGGVGSVVSLTGSWAVFVASVLIALSLFAAKKASWPVLVLLVAFGWELQLSHTIYPTAPSRSHV